MNHSLQAFNAQIAQGLVKDIARFKRATTKTLHKMEDRLGSLLTSIACRQLGLRKGTAVRLVDPEGKSELARMGHSLEHLVVDSVEFDVMETAAVLRLAQGKKASVKFWVDVLTGSGQHYLVIGTAAELKKRLVRVRRVKADRVP